MNTSTMRVAALVGVLFVGCDGGGGEDAGATLDASLDASAPDRDAAGVDAAGMDAAPPGRDGGSSPCVDDEGCDDGRFCNGVERCAPTLSSADLRGCAPAEDPTPCVEGEQECNEAMDRCAALCDVNPDVDGDGYTAPECGGTDCDDSDPRRHPDNLEVCDSAGHDEDCSPLTYGDRDLDGDGNVDARCYNTDGAGARVGGDDCDDVRGDVSPDSPEVCNGRDDDCDGNVDEGLLEPRYRDLDADGDGEEGGAVVMACPDAVRTSATNGDCDDANVTIRGGAVELCDLVDNDCDGTVDENPQAVPWYPDADLDLYGDVSADDVIVSCVPIVGRSLLAVDCDDQAVGVNPARTDVCNGIDDDCNGLLDGPDGSGGTEDDDLDGVVDAACMPGVRDRDDRDFLACGMPELCADGVDNDCDGAVDESTDPVDWYEDVDNDGWGAGSPVVSDCHFQPGLAVRSGDCDDSAAFVHPYAADVCDGFDGDCDGEVDENVERRAVFFDTDGDGVGDESAWLLVCGAAPSNYGDIPRDCAPNDPSVSIKYVDADGDSFGSSSEPVADCTDGGSYATVAGDCDDDDAMRAGVCVELCNGSDDDGDSRIDEDAALSCPNADGTMWTCVAGSCVFGGCADADHGDCDLQPTTGCETDLASNPWRCGSCTAACGAAATCAAGVCGGTVSAISAGASHACAVRDNGRVTCWGTNLPPFATPGSVPTPNSDTQLFVVDGEPVTDVDDIELEMQARLFCVHRTATPGWYCANAAGASTLVDPTTTGPAYHGLLPLPIPDPIDAFSIHSGHGCVVRAGQVACWGAGRDGELGDGLATDSSAPVTVLGVTTATDVDVGQGHSCALLADGNVSCWGRTPGNGLSTDTSTPGLIPLTGVASNPVIDLASGQGHTCALRQDGHVDCWGAGPGAIMNTTGPGRVTTTPIAGAAEIVGYGTTQCVLSRPGGGPGSAYCFGANEYGMMGVGDEDAHQTPVRFPVDNLVDLTATEWAVCALDSAGAVWCAGRDNAGLLGNGDGMSAYQLTPARVCNLPTELGCTFP